MSHLESSGAPLCFVDTETDGVHPDRKVWEVALIRLEPDGGDAESVRFFVEIDLSTADPFGLRVGRFYERHPRGQYLAGLLDELIEPDHELDWNDTGWLVTRRSAAYAVARFTHGAHLVGCVPNFDAEVLAALLRDHDRPPAGHPHLGAVEARAVGFLAGRGEPVVPPWRSEDLSRALGVEPPGETERHTALGDARWAMRLYDAVLAGGPR